LRVVRPRGHELLERPLRVLEGARLQIGGPDLAPDLVARVLLVALHHLAEVADRGLVALLVARDPAEVVVRVDLAGIDLHRLLEALDGLRDLPPLLVDEPEVIVRVRVTRVERGGLEVPLEALPPSERPLHAGDVAPEVLPDEIEDERRG